jgi:hypothetical protein
MDRSSACGHSHFAIDDDVPFPDDDVRRYPCHRLEIGQSFFVPNMRPEALAHVIREAERRTGRRFTARLWRQSRGEPGREAHVAGSRIWRMPDEWRHPPGFERTGLDADDGG